MWGACRYDLHVIDWLIWRRDTRALAAWIMSAGIR